MFNLQTIKRIEQLLLIPLFLWEICEHCYCKKSSRIFAKKNKLNPVNTIKKMISHFEEDNEPLRIKNFEINIYCLTIEIAMPSYIGKTQNDLIEPMSLSEFENLLKININYIEKMLSIMITEYDDLQEFAEYYEKYVLNE